MGQLLHLSALIHLFALTIHISGCEQPAPVNSALPSNQLVPQGNTVIKKTHEEWTDAQLEEKIKLLKPGNSFCICLQNYRPYFNSLFETISNFFKKVYQAPETTGGYPKQKNF